MNLLLSHVKNLVIGNGQTWFIYSKWRLLTQHIWEFCKCDQALFPIGTRLPVLWTHKYALKYILNLIAHCTWGKGGEDYCTVLEQDFCLVYRLVSLTVIWRVENYCNCSNAECQCSYTQNDSNHTQSSPPGRQFCKCGDWITCLIKYEHKQILLYSQSRSTSMWNRKREGKLLAPYIQLLRYH